MNRYGKVIRLRSVHAHPIPSAFSQSLHCRIPSSAPRCVAVAVAVRVPVRPGSTEGQVSIDGRTSDVAVMVRRRRGSGGWDRPGRGVGGVRRRRGAVAAARSDGAPGGPLPGLHASEKARFTEGKLQFLEVEDPAGGLGPVFNEASCVTCQTPGPRAGRAPGW